MASALTLALLTSLAAPALASISLCKCTCRIPGGEPAGNTTIVPLYLPKDPDFPCLSCSRQFCLDQKLASCVGATDEQDFEARCFRTSALAGMELSSRQCKLMPRAFDRVQSATRPSLTCSSCSSSSSRLSSSSAQRSRRQGSTSGRRTASTASVAFQL